MGEFSSLKDGHDWGEENKESPKGLTAPTQHGLSEAGKAAMSGMMGGEAESELTATEIEPETPAESAIKAFLKKYLGNLDIQKHYPPLSVDISFPKLVDMTAIGSGNYRVTNIVLQPEFTKVHCWVGNTEFHFANTAAEEILKAVLLADK